MSIHLHIPGLQGSSTDRSHSQWLDVHELKWAVQRRITSTTSTRKDRESANPEISRLNFVRYMDRATPDLFILSCCGRGQTITVRQTGTGEGSGSAPFVEYIFDNAVISNYQVMAVRQAKRRPMERICISATSAQLRYTPYDDDGRALAPISVGFDFSQNIKA